MPSNYTFLIQPVESVKILTGLKDEYGGYIDLFFNENGKEVGWQPTHLEIEDKTAHHFAKYFFELCDKRPKLVRMAKNPILRARDHDMK